MNKAFCISLFFFCYLYSYSQQNLVPNFGFEEYDTCPTNADQLEYCTGWSNYSAAFYTPDYYNACAPDTSYSVPNSILSFQQDHRNCNAYAGIVTRGGTPNDREHIGIQLTQPFMIGQKYYLSFYAVMGGEKPYAGDYYIMPSNNIGIRLSTIAYNESNPCPINNWAHLNYSAILSDSVNWTRISGSIIADSAYNYVIVGNFFDDANTDTTTLNCPNCLNEYSYYLIDDVCISTDSNLCNGGIDALPCATSIEENYFNSQYAFYPNPSTDFLNIQNRTNTPFDLAVYNSIGQLLYSRQNINSNNLQLGISSYNSGFLFIKINSLNNQLIYKFLKQ